MAIVHWGMAMLTTDADAYTDQLAPQAPTWKRPERVEPSFRAQQVIWWRERAREHLRDGDLDLARSCERNAIFWEDRP